MQVHEGTDESLVLSINVRVQHVSVLGMNMAKKAIKLENTHMKTHCLHFALLMLY